MDSRPQTSISLWLYWQFTLRKVCKALLGSSRNHFLIIKQLKIIVG
jgi:hypothetical protein